MNIDFTNKDNLIFLVVYLILAVIFFVVVARILIRLIKVIRIFIIKIFKLNVKKQEIAVDKKMNLPKQFLAPQKNEEVKHVPTQTISIDNFSNIVPSANNNANDRLIDIPEFHKEKDSKNKLEGFRKIDDNLNEKENDLVEVVPQRLLIKKEGVEPIITKSLAQESFSIGNVGLNSVVKENGKVALNNATKEQGHTTSDFVRSIVSEKKGFPGPKKASDSSIFKDGKEVSRLKLEHEMKKDSSIWKANKAVGLNLSPVERSKLVKEVFSSALGRNISKTDLNKSITKLGIKMRNTSNPEEHAKFRKEIKFFRKIGGIK